MLAALLGPMCPVPVVLSEAVPSWIGPLDVVVAHTADASDGDLAESIGRAVARGAEVVLSAPGDGPVASAGRPGTARGAAHPGAAGPRPAARVGGGAHHGRRARPAAHAVLPGLDELADTLDGEAERNAPGNEAFMNPAKSLALRLAEHTPLLWGTDPLAAAVAEHAAAALATHAGVVAHAADIAQAATATALVRALDTERDIFHDPFADEPATEAPPPRLVLIGTAEEDPLHVALRRFGRDRSAADLLHPVDEVARGVRNAPLLRAGLAATRFDWPLCTWGWPPARSPLPERRSPSERRRPSQRRTVELLTNPVRAYAWGSRTVIAELQGRPVPSPHPEAELWLGAHPVTPRTWPPGSRWSRRSRRIRRASWAPTGPGAGRRRCVPAQGARRRPAVVAAGAPSLAQARAGFAAEEAAGLPRDAPTATTATPTTSPS
jgi:hypothetical protein